MEPAPCNELTQTHNQNIHTTKIIIIVIQHKYNNIYSTRFYSASNLIGLKRTIFIEVANNYT